VDAAQIEAILKLDIDERIRIVQLIWDSIAVSSGSVPLTDDEKAAIERLVAEDDANPDDVVSWPEAKASI
jgi:putative addiction module component (TIGR02574 family)